MSLQGFILQYNEIISEYLSDNKCLNRQIMKGEVHHNQKQLQFQFDLQIQKIKLLNSISIPKSSYLQVIWRRGQKNISTKIKPEIKGTEQQIFFGETLSMISTCALNTDTQEFGLKQSIVSAVIYISGSQKLFGSVTINLSSVINPKNYYDRGVRLIEEELNGRAKSKIFMKLSCNYLKQKMKGDDQSIGSGIHSQSYNNTSTYSIERRLIDIPSKDTYSVMSYGGAPRYSNRKQDTASIRRDESAKKIQQQSSKQYGGRYGFTQQNFYTKPTNEYNLVQNPSSTPITSSTQGLSGMSAMQGITAQGSSNIKSISSIQSSANRIPRNSESENNRSVAGQQSSRLLIEEQTKRSKLEAQVTKNKVQNQELKNKLSQYVRENMKIKEELKKFYENSDSKQAETKKQNDQLKERNYVLTNEVKQLKNKFQRYIGLQKQCQNLKTQKQAFQRDSRRHQQLSNHFQKQCEELRTQLNRSKQSESKLSAQIREIREIRDTKVSKLQIEETKKKELENKIKEMNGQLQYYQNSCKNLSTLLRDNEEKGRNWEREAKNWENRTQIVRNQENRKFNDYAAHKQREIRQINEKLNLKNQQCTKYIVEAQKFKNQYGKIKDQRIAELESNRVKQASQIDRLNNNIRQALNKADQLQNEKNALNAQIRGQLVLRSKQSQKAKQAQQSLSLQTKSHQKQFSQLLKKYQHLQMQNFQLNKVLAEKIKQAQQVSSSRQELDNLLKQNLQLQLQIKYKNEESLKYLRMEQELQNVKCKLIIQEGNYRELVENYQKSQKQFKDKNRAYILECEKSRMLVEERIGANRSYNQVKEELERAKVIMDNGERQFQDMKQCIEDLENRNISLLQQIKTLENKLTSNNSDKYISQIKTLQSRLREMQLRDSQKIKSIETLHRSLANSTKQIKQLQILSEQRYNQVSSKERNIAELESKIKDLESNRNHMQNDLQNANQDKKNLSKKNQMIMEELFSYKKRFEEERGRSTSTIQSRNSEDYIKIKNLENQLQKKEDKIRKMQKQMINLQNQNVNLSIQVMKKLQDITPK